MVANLSGEAKEVALDIIEYLEEMEDEDFLLEQIEGANQEFPDYLIFWNYCTALYFCRKRKWGHAYSLLKKAYDIGSHDQDTIYLLAIVTAILGMSDDALYYIKLSAVVEELNEEFIPLWLPKFEDAFFSRDSQELLDIVRYKIRHGHYKIAYDECYDLSLAYTAQVEIFALMIQLSILINRPHNGVKYIEKLINYFQGNLISVESLLMSDLFLHLGQKENTQLWLEEAFQNFDNDNFSKTEQRLLFRFNPQYHAIKSHYRQNLIDERKELERKYCSQSNVVPQYESQKREGRKNIRLGVFISSHFNSEDRLNYFSKKLLLFKNTNLLIYFYFDRETFIDDYAKYDSLATNITYVSRVDNHTLAEIVYRDEIDILIDMNDYAIPSRIDFWKRKSAFMSVLYGGEPDTAHLWGYDAVLGDQYIYPLENGKSLERGEGIIQHEEGKASILRMRHHLLQYIAVQLLDKVDTPEKKDGFWVGVYSRRIDLDDDKIIMLRQLLQENPDMILLFESDILGGEIMFQEVMEGICDGDENLQERVTNLPYDLTLENFILFPDVILNLAPSHIQLVQNCILYERICLCYQGSMPSERVDAAILLSLNEDFKDKLVFDNWVDYKKMIVKLADDKEIRKQYYAMLSECNKQNHKKLSENIVITYDDWQFMITNFFDGKIL